MNIKLMIALIVLALMIVFILYVFVVTDPGISKPYSFKGDGSKESPYEIHTVQELEYFRDLVGRGNTFEGKYIKQTADLDLKEIKNWTPISEFGSEHYFLGTYDGAGHTINNLTIISDQNVSFFGYLCGEVMNLGIESGYIEGACIGGIASHGSELAVIFNCYNKATLHGIYRAGGIADNFSGKILYCWNLGDIVCDNGIIGGIVSYGAKIISNCYCKQSNIVPEFIGGKVQNSNTVFIEDISEDCVEKFYDPLFHDMSEGENKDFFSTFNELPISFIRAENHTITFSGQNYMPKNIEKKKKQLFFADCGVILLYTAVSAIFLLIVLVSRKRCFTIDDSVVERTGEVQRQINTNRSFVGLIFVSVFVLAGTYFLNRTLMVKRGDGVLQMQDYYEQPANAVDVLIVGSSKAGCNLDSEELWKKYGISSYILWGAVQPSWNSYYFLKEAIKENRPKVAVISLSTTYVTEYAIDSYQHANICGMKMSLDKLRAVQVTAPQERWLDLLLGFPLYHARYTELGKSDFQNYFWNDREMEKGGHPTWYGSATLESYGDASNVEAVESIPEKHEVYLRKSIELCQNENIPLLLVATPASDRNGTQPYLNYIQNIADEYGIPFINYNVMDDQTGFVISDILSDNFHLNTNGARKISSHLGKYVKDHYGLEDHRGDAYYRSWEEYSHKMENDYYAKITGIDDYLAELMRNDREVFFVKWNVSGLDEGYETFKQRMAATGFSIDFLEGNQGERRWTLQSIQNGKADLELEGTRKASLKLGDKNLEIDPYQERKVLYDEKMLCYLESGVYCVVYDPYTEEIADTCCLYKPGTESVVTHY